MKVTVCEFNKSHKIDRIWVSLIKHLKKNKSEFLLLPEMAFYNWVCRDERLFIDKWIKTVNEHETWINRLSELNVPIIAGSRPVIDNGKYYNEGFVWTKENGYNAVHRKVYLPNVKGFWEANWYSPGDKVFNAFDYKGIKIGFLICTELWFLQHAREYSKQEVHILVCPRSTPLNTKPKWISGGITASVVSGAFCLSSNFSGSENGLKFAGMGWITEPEEGKIIKLTNNKMPFATTNINLATSDKAKTTYPRNVID